MARYVCRCVLCLTMMFTTHRSHVVTCLAQPSNWVSPPAVPMPGQMPFYPPQYPQFISPAASYQTSGYGHHPMQYNGHLQQMYGAASTANMGHPQMLSPYACLPTNQPSKSSSDLASSNSSDSDSSDSDSSNSNSSNASSSK